MEKFKAFIFNGKGNVTLSLSILGAIVVGTWHISVQFERLTQKIDHNTTNPWTSVHQKIYNEQLRTCVQHGVPNVNLIVETLGE